MEKINIEKNIWTEADFERMGWHDCTIYGMALKNGDEVLSSKILFDIDYIFKWIHPEPHEDAFSFWVAPCTLIFKQVFNLTINVGVDSSSVFELEIAAIHRVSEIESLDGKPRWEWHIELQQGDIRFEANGYEQIVRQEPVYLEGQQIPACQRGEVNFGLVSFPGMRR